MTGIERGGSCVHGWGERPLLSGGAGRGEERIGRERGCEGDGGVGLPGGAKGEEREEGIGPRWLGRLGLEELDGPAGPSRPS